MHVDPDRIAGDSPDEVEFLYREIFTRRTYLRYGLMLPNGSVVFDVGANVGIFSLFVHAVCPTASVFAFEPLPPAFANLRHNLGVYGVRARLFNHGLSDSDQEVPFLYYPRHSALSTRAIYADEPTDRDIVQRTVEGRKRRTGDTGARPVAAEELAGPPLASEEYVCRQRPLSDVIDEQGIERIDMLKIDVQRSELDVLQGIRERHWPLILQVAAEIHDGPGLPTWGRLGTVITLLIGHGFQVTAAQEPDFVGTDRYMVYASRTLASHEVSP
ncbi:FkbM family methyltransferase [Streptomyces sp. SCSIO 30461]|uniref:FkbM family methyltransferase n=1 Tax=Streptomyces sp. SCSIO 30461 TaxID=3118085 RepID=UPI0030CEF953